MKLKKFCLFVGGLFMISTNFSQPLSLIDLRIPRDACQRVVSSPYISGDTFRAWCDHIVDETNETIDVSKIKERDIVFVNGEYIKYFFEEIHPTITTQYILLTHNSDAPIPGGYKNYLDDKKIFAWFGQNLDAHHAKLFALPIGLANRYWPYGSVEIVDEALKNVISERTILLYMNFSQTNPYARKNVEQYFSEKTFCYQSPKKSYAEYLEDLKKSKFVVSPPGIGIDCYRTWEALLMGAIPIVQKSCIDGLFENLPVLIISDWSEVTEEFLEKKYQEFQNKSYLFEKLYIQYWFDQIKKIQIKIR